MEYCEEKSSRSELRKGGRFLNYTAFRYLHSFLAGDMESFLSLVAPLLLRLPPPKAAISSSPKKRPRASLDGDTEEKATDPGNTKNPQNEKHAASDFAGRASRLKGASRRTVSGSRKEDKTKEQKVRGVALLAAKAVACVLRRAASESHSFFLCVEGVLRFFFK